MIIRRSNHLTRPQRVAEEPHEAVPPEVAVTEAQRSMFAPADLTDREMTVLTGTDSQEEWEEACDLIKSRRQGRYPSDWQRRVISAGLMANREFSWSQDAKRREREQSGYHTPPAVTTSDPQPAQILRQQQRQSFRDWEIPVVENALNTSLTPDEADALRAADSEQRWMQVMEATRLRILQNQGDIPNDWLAKVKATGLLNMRLVEDWSQDTVSINDPQVSVSTGGTGPITPDGNRNLYGTPNWIDEPDDINYEESAEDF